MVRREGPHAATDEQPDRPVSLTRDRPPQVTSGSSCRWATASAGKPHGGMTAGPSVFDSESRTRRENKCPSNPQFNAHPVLVWTWQGTRRHPRATVPSSTRDLTTVVISKSQHHLFSIKNGADADGQEPRTMLRSATRLRTLSGPGMTIKMLKRAARYRGMVQDSGSAANMLVGVATLTIWSKSSALNVSSVK